MTENHPDLIHWATCTDLTHYLPSLTQLALHVRPYTLRFAMYRILGKLPVSTKKYKSEGTGLRENVPYWYGRTSACTLPVAAH